MRLGAGLLTLGILATAGLGGAAHAATATTYPASFFELVPIDQPPEVCISTATKALKAAGFTIGNWTSNELTVGGTTKTTRGFVVCVKQPKAGLCGKPGTSALLVTAGADAKRLLKALTRNFTPPKPAACGPA